MSSSFENKSPRLLLRDKDNAEGMIPLARRFSTRTSPISTGSFNDRRIFLFTGSSEVSYPVGMMSADQHLSGNTTIVASGRVVKGVGDDNQKSDFHYYTPDFGAYVEDGIFAMGDDPFFLTSSNDADFSAKLRDKVQIKIDIATSTDARFTRARRGLGIADPGAFLSGTEITGFSYYNFRTKRWDQIGNLDPETGGSLPFDWRVRPSGNYQTISSGTNHYPSQFVPYHGGPPTWSGSAPTTESLTEIQAQEILRRKRVGSPSVTCFAPFANKYHASSSQTLKLSNYISQPFLLEKVVVNLPIKAERRSNSATFFSSSNYTIGQEDYVFFIYRQEKNFFASTGSSAQFVNSLVQPSRTEVRSLPEWPTGSMRYLICSGVMTFYNSYVLWPTGVSGVNGLNGYEPLNTPAFSYNWNIASNSNPATANAAVFTGSVMLKMPVAVASPYMSTDHHVYSSTASLKRGKIQHYWPGGTAALPFGTGNISGKQDRGALAILEASQQNAWITQGALVNEPQFGTPTFEFYAEEGLTSPSFSAAKKRMRIEKFDPRATKIMGGKTASGSLTNEQSSVSPYLLLPSDELVFGFEAALPSLGFNDTGVGFELGTENNVTGSMLRITTGNATVTLYGSLMREGVPYDPGYEQYLTTPSLTEFIGEDVSDQFFIQPSEHKTGYSSLSFTGSIFSSVDQGLIVSGSSATLGANEQRRLNIIDGLLPRHVRTILDPFQLVIFDFILLNDSLPPTGSGFSNDTWNFGRRGTYGMKIPSKNERFYDTIMPSIESYLVNAGASRTGSYMSSSTITIPESSLKGRLYKFSGGSRIFLEKNRTSSSFTTMNAAPYRTNPSRSLQDTEIYLVVSKSDSTGVNAYSEFLLTNQSLLKMALFMRGYKISQTGFGDESANQQMQHDLTGAYQTKYGIQNALPIFSEQVFRTDRYGQFRDRLEQRKFGIFYDVVGINDDGTVTGKKGKKVGPVTIRFQNTGRFVRPSATVLSGSSNRSTEATSSMPYIDGEYNNWSSVF